MFVMLVVPLPSLNNLRNTLLSKEFVKSDLDSIDLSFAPSDGLNED